MCVCLCVYPNEDVYDPAVQQLCLVQDEVCVCLCLFVLDGGIVGEGGRD